ncbi:Arrestin domain-containing protein 17 [Pseudolycoriella hygida]|uniref:Arrestin domain-containing protein 17 n=1 Tax=Pseudolycoriella hygida TaxID=35572 RepID=A0A9Q0N3G4_9DIPT|nr:Arrestin domain-containing protein 17 [Pseudolycoriella hygida]
MYSPTREVSTLTREVGLYSQIILDQIGPDGKPLFNPGQHVSGIIVVASNSPRKIKGIQLRIIGKSYVKFAEIEDRANATNSSTVQLDSGCSKSQKSQFVRVDYEGERTHMDVVMDIHGYDGKECIIKYGKSAFPFHFILPRNIPPSFKGAYGWTEYLLKAETHPLFGFDHISEKPITIVEIVDLNCIDGATDSVSVVAEKPEYCEDEILEATLQVQRQSATPGETMSFSVLVAHTICNTYTQFVSLQQEITYVARGKSRTQIKNIHEILGDVLCEGTESPHKMEGSFKVEQGLIPTTISTAHLIEVEYKLVLELKSEAIGVDIIASIPIIIGNVPLQRDPPRQVLPTSSERMLSISPLARHFKTSSKQNLSTRSPFRKFMKKGLRKRHNKKRFQRIKRNAGSFEELYLPEV